MSSPTNKQPPDTPSASPTAATAAAALTSSPNAFARSPSVCSQDSRSITGGGGGAASITTTGSGSLTGSPSPLSSPRDLQQPQLLTNHPPQPQPAPSALAISAAKSAALAAVNITSSSSSSVGGGGGGNKVLPPPWPETTSSSPPTGTTTTAAAAAAAVNKSLPAIPILRNNSHNSANSSAATTMPGLTHSISLTASTEDHSGTTSSNNTTTTTATNNANNNPSKLPTTAVGTATTGAAAAATTSVNSSVLLGLEELERQQAYAEKKKAELWKAEMTMKQHEGGNRRSLPPLAPAPSSGPAKFTPMMFSSQQQPPFSQQQQIMLQQQQQQYANPNQLPPPPPQQYHYQHQFQQQPHHHQQQHPNNPRSSPSNVPTQIHLTSLNNIDTDDPTALSSIENRSKEEDAASSTTAAQTQGGDSSGGGGGGGSMKRIASIEKFQKSAQNTFRRFRSWSQGGGLTSSETTGTGGTGGGGYEGGGIGGKASRSMSMNSPPPPSSSSRKNLPTPNTPGLNPTPTKLPNPQQQQRLSETTQEPYLDEDELTPLIYGYLHKLGRNGHWQKRFFETNGERLTYYKSGKRKKVLATLDLYKVGEIAIDKTDPEECTFTIQVSNRPYYLRAEDKARCNDWVIILNRAREARHGWGNIQLVNPTGIDDDVVGGVGGGRSQAGSDDEFGPCIVISALRPRTQAVNYGEDDAVLPPDLLSAGGVGGSEEQEQIEVLDGRDNPQLLMMQHQQQQQQQYQMEDEQQLQGGRPVAVKWQKRHSAVHHLSMRMLNWARSITSNADACRRQKDVVVVPAHVMRSMMSQSVAASGIGGEQTGMGGEGGPIGAAIAAEASAAPTPGGINVTRPSVSGAPKGLQDVLEETPSTEANDGERERKRTESSESTSGGMGSSQYV
eukprot:CAMPEP_0113409002 /NCGR_PEP_ID=MMETSP0013_2-20120614/20912_1 /TAXON_ID=2843 ORGANISM="Skeletonema costatum, Strain 1716" /NCGR_SAMPLE_ID=MMETSP0013_2 /ASSEMBLY_ACC=CAM_ASM_000158 /LENGTH=896 /DNA_ID=CAMNT_0000295085 /DNA_START=147 /DNA_END=2837 /DNA_ORIENTATION=+ /assembly_acc=CAM_ASM_000158